MPQVVEDNAYDRYSAYYQDREAVGQLQLDATSRDGILRSGRLERTWTDHYIVYDDVEMREVEIKDNDFLRAVTVGEETTYTIHWTGVAMGAYYAAVLLSVVLVLVRCHGSRRRLLRRSARRTRTTGRPWRRPRRRVNCGWEAALYRCPGLHAPVQNGDLESGDPAPETLPEGSRAAALDHELTHLKRVDVGYLALLALVRCVYWFNPLVWLMVRAARRDMELCCDDDLLRGRDEAARRAYGRAILDQMTARERGTSGLFTGLLRGKREVFARFRAMMDPSPRKKGGAVLALAAAAIVLSGSLVSCQTSGPPAGGGARERPVRRRTGPLGLDRERGPGGSERHLHPHDAGAARRPEGFWAELGDLERETAPVWEDVTLLHSYEGERHALNPTTLQHTLGMSQAGLPGYVLVNRDGEAVEIYLECASRLDLSAADLDFTGYCGYVYAAGQGGARLLHGQAAVSLDPCDEFGRDGDHTWYTLPLAEEFTSTEELRSFLTGTSSANYPVLFQCTVVDGAVTAVEGIWAEAEP